MATKAQTEKAVQEKVIEAVIVSKATRSSKAQILKEMGLSEEQINQMLPARGGMQKDILAIKQDVIEGKGKSSFLAAIAGKTGDNRAAAAKEWFKSKGLSDKEATNPTRHIALRVSAATAMQEVWEAAKATK